MDIHSAESHMEIYCEVFFLSWVIILGLEGLLQSPPVCAGFTGFTG